MNKLSILALILILLIIPLAQCEIESLGIFKIGECISLYQQCSNCSFVNISSVLYPNSTQALGQVKMTKTGTKYNYTSCDISQSLGTYIVNGFGDVDGVTTVFAYDYTVTPTGTEMTGSKATIIFMGLGLLMLIGLLLFIFGIYSKTLIIKIFSLGLSVLVMTLSVGYLINVLNIGITEYTGLTGNINSLYYLITVLLIIGGIGLILFLIWYAFIMFSKMRGFRD